MGVAVADFAGVFFAVLDFAVLDFAAAGLVVLDFAPAGLAVPDLAVAGFAAAPSPVAVLARGVAVAWPVSELFTERFAGAFRGVVTGASSAGTSPLESVVAGSAAAGSAVVVPAGLRCAAGFLAAGFRFGFTGAPLLAGETASPTDASTDSA